MHTYIHTYTLTYVHTHTDTNTYIICTLNTQVIHTYTYTPYILTLNFHNIQFFLDVTIQRSRIRTLASRGQQRFTHQVVHALTLLCMQCATQLVDIGGHGHVLFIKEKNNRVIMLLTEQQEYLGEKSNLLTPELQKYFIRLA